MSLNIWILNHYAGHPCGCSNTRHYSLARHLVAAGHSVTIFSSAFDHATRQQRAEPSSEEVINEVRFVWLPTGEYKGNDLRRTRSFVLYLWQAGRAGWKRRPKPNVVWGSSPHPLAALAAFILARRHRARFLFEVRDVWPESLIDLGGYSPRHPAIVLLRMLVSCLYRQADLVISVLPGLNAQLKARGIPDDRLFLLPNAGEGLGFSPDIPSDLQDELDRLRDRVKVVYAGAHGQGNNLDEVLRMAEHALTKAPDLQFVMIGDGPDKARLQRAAAEGGLSNVTFLRPVPRYAIGTVLKQMDIGLVSLKPARVFEVFGISPNKLALYQEAGLPVMVIGPRIRDNATTSGVVTVAAGAPATAVNLIREITQRAMPDGEAPQATTAELACQMDRVFATIWPRERGAPAMRARMYEPDSAGGMAGDTKLRESAFFDAWLADGRKSVLRGIQYSPILLAPVHDTFWKRVGSPVGLDILDYGCGTGALTVQLALKGASVTGVDISSQRLARAIARAETQGVHPSFVQGDGEDTGLPAQAFDMVVGGAILHHLHLDRACREIARVLKPGGRAVFIEPLDGNPFINLFRKLTPSKRTADERPLGSASLQLIRKHFREVHVYYRLLTSLLYIPLALLARRDISMAASCLHFFDAALVKIPFVQRLSWQAVIELRQ